MYWARTSLCPDHSFQGVTEQVKTVDLCLLCLCTCHKGHSGVQEIFEDQLYICTNKDPLAVLR